MANFNKVIKVLNIKSAVSLQLTSARAQSTQHVRLQNTIELSRLRFNGVNCKLTADFIFKSIITLLKLAIGTLYFRNKLFLKCSLRLYKN